MAFQHGTGVPSIPGDQQGGMQERDVINALLVPSVSRSSWKGPEMDELRRPLS